jgi:hypothetical protein
MGTRWGYVTDREQFILTREESSAAGYSSHLQYASTEIAVLSKYSVNFLFSVPLKGWINMMSKTQFSLMRRWQLWLGVILFLLSLLVVGVHSLTTAKAHAATGLVDVYDHTGPLGKTVIHSIQVYYTFPDGTGSHYCSTNSNPILTNPIITTFPLPVGTELELTAARDGNCLDQIINLPGYATQRIQIPHLDQLPSCQVSFFPVDNFLAEPIATGCGPFYT